MKEEEPTNVSSKDKKETTSLNLPLKHVQGIVTIGYLSLLVFGLIRETVTYGILDINIISYSSVLDILLRPINILLADLYLLIFIVIMPVLFYLGLKLMEGFHNRNKGKEWYQKRFDVAKIDGQYANQNGTLVLLVTMVYGLLFGFFLSDAVNEGFDLKEEIEAGTHKITHQITFKDQEQLKVKIIGQNSQYLFYVLEEGQEILISPIHGNVKQIKYLTE